MNNREYRLPDLEEDDLTRIPSEEERDESLGALPHPKETKPKVAILGAGLPPDLRLHIEKAGILTRTFTTEEFGNGTPLYQNGFFGKEDIFSLAKQNGKGGSHRPSTYGTKKPTRVKKKHARANKRKKK